MSEELDDAKLNAAIDRIARSEDGLALYRYCQKRLSSITLAGSGNELVQRNEGAREFAATLMGLMAEGIDYSGRGNTVVFRTGRASVEPDSGKPGVFKPRPGGRRVSSNTYVPGFDGPTDSGEPDASGNSPT